VQPGRIQKTEHLVTMRLNPTVKVCRVNHLENDRSEFKISARWIDINRVNGKMEVENNYLPQRPYSNVTVAMLRVVRA
jgi:hypothetical protein